ncbi:MAG: UDP-N-acetylmuramate:L-alanyl-gamma-D-glutamyl-meso-diaminopimelate ligase [Gammaproteobacteria bacterium]|nr:UDP-N-acetylmuramate:L-alanyl-gamma-D-glutamyl-meso-diaminopimelate ligase [Gammaproteobacteria bacterium]MDH5777025.1 UDP-N-acetylmuramate:L-alanyl-gamma-D-glutamyl-meso-diaminopimelate ligase [Gammaproteobacteria bacterium]
MHIHILGICGTFMGGVALLARALGHEVSGSDANVYPPMSTQLEEQGIRLQEGYDPAHLDPAPDCVVIGNAMSRGNPAVEYVLDKGLPYTSGPQWLAEHVLQQRWVLAVAGTHGKTSTSSILAWLLEANGLAPGFLIGGVPNNFGVSARLGETPFFVVEADEYDTAFFDKRSKFVHYHPRTAILNNLEFDHADIFADLEAIKTQFHHLVRTVPGTGLIIAPDNDEAIADVLERGCWTPVESFAGQTEGWTAKNINADASCFDVMLDGQTLGQVNWPLIGEHNKNNALAAIAAARHAGISPEHAIESLSGFKGIRRRMELRGRENEITVYDDFAHHPTAISLTVAGLRKQVGQERILAVLEPRSNTMRMGVHADTLAPSLKEADYVFIYQADNVEGQAEKVSEQRPDSAWIFNDVQKLIDAVIKQSQPGDHILVMSNGGFDNIHERLLQALKQV